MGHKKGTKFFGTRKHPEHPLPERLAGRGYVKPGQPGNQMTKPKNRKGAR